MFQRNVQLTSLRVQSSSKPLIMEAIQSFKMLDATYPVTHHHILVEDLKSVWKSNKTIKLAAS
jgi:hypothetical protein